MAAKPRPGGSSKAGGKPSSKSSSASRPSSASKAKPKSKASAPKQHKPAPLSAPQKQKAKKKRTYTDKELGIGPLNGIVPAGIQKRPNAKKGKKFVEDRQQMDLIMKMVMAEKEGNIESKMMKARQMEEIREVRRQEMERRAEGKREGLEERKRSIKEKGKRRKSAGDAGEGGNDLEKESSAKKAKKRVSFG